MGNSATLVATAKAAPEKIPRTPTDRWSESVDGHFVYSQDGQRVVWFAARNGLRLWDDLLAQIARLASRRSLDDVAPSHALVTPRRRQTRLVESLGGQFVRPGSFWGAQIGPNPTDRAKAGTKHHVLTEAQGIPLATQVTAANVNDVTQLQPLVEAIPLVLGRGLGRPKFRPQRVQGDRGYDSEAQRQWLRQQGITPVLARRNTPHGSGLGVHRWYVERTLSWLHQFRRLRIRYDRRAEIHEAFVSLACSLICFRNSMIVKFG